MTQGIVIVGASARAAVQSAILAGLQPYAVDQFNDEDLLACAPAIRIHRYRDELLSAVRQFPIAPVLYTGALENYPSLLAQLARERSILGNTADTVRAVRNPWQLQATLRSHDCHSPELRRHGAIPTDDNWIVKPFHSGGGLGIHRHTGRSTRDHILARSTKRVYFQRFVPGEPISALYVGAGGSAELLGVTRQLIGCTWAGAEPFHYVGNIGAISVSSNVRQQLQRIGNSLAQSYRLQGLFGVDAIAKDGDVWVLEVNPRYTAAVEILERSLGLSALLKHLQACCGGESVPIPVRDTRQLHGKAVLYVRKRTVIPPRFTAWNAACNHDAEWPGVADIPATGTKIDGGTPLCTIFAAANSESAVLHNLQQHAREVFELLEPPEQTPS